MTIPILLLLLTIALQFVCLPILFKKAGIEAWKGYVPIYNWFVWAQLLERPWYWAVILMIPGVNFFMFPVFMVETANAFGKRTLVDHLLATFLPFVFFPMLAFGKDISHTGPIDWKEVKKGMLREWGHAIVYAIIAATIIRTFFIEAYTIPTGSMEKSLLIGDYLFVSKVSYGARMPQTLLSVPFTHHSLPGGTTPSFVDWYNMPYFRLPGFGDVERFDPMVFNFPKGDTVILAQQAQDMEQNARDLATGIYGANFTETQYQEAKERMLRDYEYVIRPNDKKEHYIKRCVGLPGETIEITDSQVYIDGTALENPEKLQYEYTVTTSDQINKRNWKNQFDISDKDIIPLGSQRGEYVYSLPMSASVAAKVKALPLVKRVEKKNTQQGIYNKNSMPIFPNHRDYGWSEDNFGPLYIPKAGESIDITLENLPLYERVISNYEGNELKVDNGQILINGEAVTKYTFQQDYYWLMGDNRHHSADSRFWGFVPENHVVGKAVFIWFSKDPDTGIRWNRLFSLVD